MKKSTLLYRLTIVIFFVFICATGFAQDVNSKEMLISVPYLTDKNAELIRQSLERTEGVGSIEACYDLHVVIIRYDSKSHTEESLLEYLRTIEMNSQLELLYSRDISAIRRSYKLISVTESTHRKQ